MLSMTSNLSTKFLWTSDPFFRSCSQVLGLNHIPYSLGVIAGQESPEASPSSSPTIPLTSVEANNTNNPVLTKDAVQQVAGEDPKPKEGPKGCKEGKQSN